jgi:hypothetical protein
MKEEELSKSQGNDSHWRKMAAGVVQLISIVTTSFTDRT